MDSVEQYHELSFYTLGLQDPGFIHQHIVDAYAAQTADEKTKVITVFFALAGLYLFLEKDFTGKQIQDAHQLMASKTKSFVKINLPGERGMITVNEVLEVPAGSRRNEMIRQWCQSVWTAYSGQHRKVIEMTESLLNSR
jgi:hypothetical protein